MELLTTHRTATDAIARFWPIVLVLDGLLVLFNSLRRPRSRARPAYGPALQGPNGGHIWAF